MRMFWIASAVAIGLLAFAGCTKLASAAQPPFPTAQTLKEAPKQAVEAYMGCLRICIPGQCGHLYRTAPCKPARTMQEATKCMAQADQCNFACRESCTRSHFDPAMAIHARRK